MLVLIWCGFLVDIKKNGKVSFLIIANFQFTGIYEFKVIFAAGFAVNEFLQCLIFVDFDLC